MRIAGIDQGTTSTRALVAGADGRLEVVKSVEHRQSYPRAGWVEHDPEELIRNILACAEACGRVDAIGIDNQGESCLAWDASTKEALTPVIVWQDNRTTGTIERLKSDGVEPDVLQRAGLPLDPYFSASKLAWIIENTPQARRAHARGDLRLGTTDAFFLDRLTGRFITDVTTASRTSLMNLETLQWDTELCEIFSVPLDALPQIVSTTGDFGHVKTDHGPVPVTASVVDQQAALYGFGCRGTGDVKITFGTGAFALAVTGAEIVRRPEVGLLPTVAWQKHGEPPIYAVDGGVFAASAAINWAQSLGLFSDYDEINAFDGAPMIEDRLVFVPALMGLGCPYWEPRARGAWLGLSLNHQPKHLVQAILEGIAFRTAEVVEAMSECIPLRDALLIDGGMSSNPYFVQFLATVLNREIHPARIPEQTAIGTISLACDAAEGDVPISQEFGLIRPEENRRNLLEPFKRAVGMARNWNTD